MGLDSRFIIASDLQSLFRDKDTGLPLRNGKIYFWEDESRTTPKDVYKLSGSPPNYSYVSLGAVINLTSSGTVSDNGNNDIILYYFTREGLPEDESETTELYYVQVYSEGGTVSGVLQFTREGWPNFIGDADSTQTDFTNYVPNGQFLLHNDIPADAAHVPPYVAGEIRQAITTLSQGGWTFERPEGSTAKDIVLFQPINSYVTNPSASPKYSIEISNEVPSAGDSYKDLRLKFTDVNKFASDTQQYTFAFTGTTNTGDNLSITLVLIKTYFTAPSTGSPTEEIPLGNLTIPDSYAVIQKSFSFGNNTGKTIGEGDYIQLAIRFSTGSIFDVSLTDFILTPDAVTIDSFPQTPDNEFISDSIAGWMNVPAYDGSNLYLTPRLTPSGMTWDTSEIGDIVPESQLSVYVNSLHPTVNRMLANGAYYETAGYSPLGIPYRRLWERYWLTADLLPMYGTGSDYLTAYYTDLVSRAQIFLSTNKPGSATATADGTPATGFTFVTLHTGANYNVKGLVLGGESFYIWDNNYGLVTGSNTPGDSGFSVTTIVNSTQQRQIVEVGATNPAALAGKYFKFANTTVQYYVWFTVDGAGADPALPGETGIHVKLFSSMDSSDVALAVRASISGSQLTLIDFIAGSTIPAGSYFLINTASGGSLPTEFYVWYKVDGAGNDPALSNKTGILVEINSADTAAQVTTKTVEAINSKYFAVPDVRGMFLRAWNDGAGIDTGLEARWSNVPYHYGDEIGTYEFGDIQTHHHDFSYNNPAGQAGSALAGGAGFEEATDTGTTDATGGGETRPVNFSANCAIKY